MSELEQIRGFEDGPAPLLQRVYGAAHEGNSALAFRRGRPTSPAQVMGFSALVLLVARPENLFDVGFLLGSCASPYRNPTARPLLNVSAPATLSAVAPVSTRPSTTTLAPNVLS